MQIAKRAARWAKNRLGRAMHRPRIKLDKISRPITTLGHGSYGAWPFVDTGKLKGCTIISAGLGEDASFEVAFATQYNARVIIVDPTPRAIDHFAGIVSRLGKPQERSYPDTGPIPVEAYDLRWLTPDNLSLVPKALWRERGQLNFYPPKNPGNVSHSLVNLQGTSKPIVVEAVAVSDILTAHGMSFGPFLPLLKLDIEGAETQVLNGMLRDCVFPEQIAVEYDEMANPTLWARNCIEETHRELVKAGYGAVYYDGHETYLYWRH